MEYVELLLSAKHWFLFFDKRLAVEKSKDLKKQGFQSRIVQEKGNHWTVFQLTN